MEDKKEIFKQIISTLALLVAIIYSVFLLPYVIFVNRGSITWVEIIIYLVAVFAYTVWWALDKGRIVSDEL